MIEGLSPTVQAFLGTLLTWGLTAAGSAVVFFVPSSQRVFLDGSLGFAAGVMLAASFWSLLDPAIEMATESGYYGEEGQYSFLPVSLGFFLGALFVFSADELMKRYLSSYSIKNVLEDETYPKENLLLYYSNQSNYYEGGILKQRKMDNYSSNYQSRVSKSSFSQSYQQWKRILLMVVAITVHNIPEGLAVGVGFGAVGKSNSATFAKAKNLAIGIGIQNFPEGMAVSLPLRSSGYSFLKAFWWGQLSGMVEPLAGIFGAMAVETCEPLLPYALAFAAGAMIYVVTDDIIPEMHSSGNGRLSSFWCITGFIVMMALDVGLA